MSETAEMLNLEQRRSLRDVNCNTIRALCYSRPSLPLPQEQNHRIFSKDVFISDACEPLDLIK